MTLFDYKHKLYEKAQISPKAKHVLSVTGEIDDNRYYRYYWHANIVKEYLKKCQNSQNSTFYP